MTMTTRLLSVSVPVADQDAALRFYTEVLGCAVRADFEPWPGAQLHNDEVLHLDGAPPMFHFADPDGNGLVYLQEG